ncbi:hypothetical protein BVRB_029860, partial [Beta vulgaris subsp. vulgaris]
MEMSSAQSLEAEILELKNRLNVLEGVLTAATSAGQWQLGSDILHSMDLIRNEISFLTHPRSALPTRRILRYKEDTAKIHCRLFLDTLSNQLKEKFGFNSIYEDASFGDVLYNRRVQASVNGKMT